MRTIVLINCYFGKFPPYMNLFLESCRKNHTSIEREEFMYIHFQKRDMPQDSNLGNCFFVTYRGFVKCEKEAIDQKDIMTYNKFNMVGQIITTCKYSLWKVKRKINKIRNMRSGK